MEKDVAITMAILSLAKAIEFLTIAKLNGNEKHWEKEAIEMTKKAEEWISGERLKEI